MVSNRPIFAIGPDFAEIITTTNTVFFYYSEKVAKSVILDFIINFARQIAGKWVGLQQYSRKN
jgi:hypothetical protein